MYRVVNVLCEIWYKQGCLGRRIRAIFRAAMSRAACVTPPSRCRRASPPRVLRTGQGELLLADDETLVIHLLSGGSFALDSIARREAGATTTQQLRRFLAWELRVLSCQVRLLDGLRLLSDDDPIFRSTLSVAVVPGKPREA